MLSSCHATNIILRDACADSLVAIIGPIGLFACAVAAAAFIATIAFKYL